MGRFFHWQYLYLWSFDFPPRPPHWLGGFLSIDFLSDFPPQFPTGLEGFSPAIWPLETHQLLYKAKMFSVVLRFCSSVSLIRLRGFSPSSHFPSMILCSMELTSEEDDNCNNVTSKKFPKRKSYDNNHTKPHPGQFDLLRNASPSLTLTWSRGTFSPYILVSLHTRLFTHLSPYAFVSLRPCVTVTSMYQPEKYSA